MTAKLRISIIAALAFSVSACLADPSLYGKIKPYNASDKKSFVFSVDEKFINNNKNSKKDKDYPLMSKAEAELLKELLQQNDYCLNGSKPSFRITSQQEKIYDITFAHLIEQSYNAKPISPRMYFGECVEKRS